MNKRNSLKRRGFFKQSAKYAAATLFMSTASTKVFGAINFMQSNISIPNVVLNNGLEMPMLGFGTNTLNGDLCSKSVSEAISAGYRLIDTAHIYGNEKSVGDGIKLSGINREELFVTSKLWVDDSGYDTTKKAFETTINKLGVEYLDLYLIHRPRGDVKGTWKAMEDLYKEGKIKAIGISNFEPKQIEELMEYANIKPVLNQIETHAFFQENKSYDYLKKSQIQMEAWSPLAEGRNNIFTNKTLASIGEKHNKSIAQVSLRWHYQRGIVAIPRSSNKNHIKENLNIFDFELDKSDFETIAKLDLNRTQFPEWS